MVVRLPMASLLCVVVWMTVAVGNDLAGRFLGARDLVTLGAVLFIGCFSGLLTFWVASQITGLRLVISGQPRSQSFNLRDVLLAMAIIRLPSPSRS